MAGPIIRLKELIAHTGLSRSAIYDRMDKKSPRYADDFPKSFPLGGNAIGWYKSDIDAWLEKCANNPKSQKPSKKAQKTTNPKSLVTSTPSKPVHTALQPPASKSIHPTPQSRPKQTGRKGNLAEAIVMGGNINNRLLGYLQMQSWTPVMGALLVCGIEPPQNCIEIPEGGVGLDEIPLHGSNGRFNDARRILKERQEWSKEQEDQLPEIKPIHFLCWCVDEDINSEWLKLFLQLSGYIDKESVDLTASRFALLTNI